MLRQLTRRSSGSSSFFRTDSRDTFCKLNHPPSPLTPFRAARRRNKNNVARREAQEPSKVATLQFPGSDGKPGDVLRTRRVISLVPSKSFSAFDLSSLPPCSSPTVFNCTFYTFFYSLFCANRESLRFISV